jgi:Rab GDP dissociation inhibitor
MKTVYEKFGLEPGTQDFIGHAMALYLDDESVPAIQCNAIAPLICYS